MVKLFWEGEYDTIYLGLTPIVPKIGDRIRIAPYPSIPPIIEKKKMKFLKYI